MSSDFSQNISQALRQTLRLSPMQMQLVKLLEMSAPELDDEIRRQLDDNPALITAEHTDTPEESSFNESAEELQRADYASEDDVPFVGSHKYSASEGFRPELRDTPQTLQENLIEQINRTVLPHDIAQAALYIIGNLDDNGYLHRSLRALETDLDVAGHGISHEKMREAFEHVRELDPPGVGAVDLRDCLLLQLHRLEHDGVENPSLPLAIEIIADYFDLLGKKHYDKLMREMGIQSQEQLKAAIELIRSLNPKPGGASSGDGQGESAATIIPDFSVEIEGDRAIVNLLSTPPELRIEETFSREAEKPASTPEQRRAAAFIKLKRDEAAAFIDVLQRRSRTMMAVMRAIVHFQWQFFLTGDISTLRPLVLRELASYTGLDISVISRATQGKYVSTIWGTFPLKMFFNERTSDDSDATSLSMLEAVKNVIEKEDPAHPLSDRAICEALAANGITLARRTVTKYRERLGLPPGRLRKKL